VSLRTTAAGLVASALAGCGEPAGEPAVPGFQPCVGPVPILDGVGQPTGFVRCTDGSVDRVGSWTGDPETYTGAFGDPSRFSDEYECNEDADCGGLPVRCVVHRSCKNYDYPGCEVVCGSDTDCLDGEVCVPPELGGARWPTCERVGDCRTGTDCASGECGAYIVHDEGVGLFCRSATDTCRSDEDCTDPWGWVCQPFGPHWSCESFSPGCD
jgi:hypothetical protein